MGGSKLYIRVQKLSNYINKNIMTEHNDTTLLIQGPLTNYTLYSMYRYKGVFDIVISTPLPTISNQTVYDEIMKVVNEKNSNVTIFTYGDILRSTYNNDQNRYYQFFSVYYGLSACKTEYTIKIRSDEFYSNIPVLIDTMKKNRYKIITNDVFFRNSKFLFHPSDHLVAGRTKLMNEVFSSAKNFCEDRSVIESNPYAIYVKEKSGTDRFTSEQLIGIATITFLQPSREPSDIDPVISMKNCFHIVKSEDLGVFRIAFNSSPTKNEFTDNTYLSKTDDITDIEEYI